MERSTADSSTHLWASPPSSSNWSPPSAARLKPAGHQIDPSALRQALGPISTCLPADPSSDLSSAGPQLQPDFSLGTWKQGMHLILSSPLPVPSLCYFIALIGCACGSFAYKTEHVTWGCPLLACILVFCLVDADSSGPLVV